MTSASRSAAIAALVAALVTGCGSTVALSNAGGAARGGQDGLTAQTSVAGSAATPAGDHVPVGTPGALGGSAGSTVVAGGSQATASRQPNQAAPLPSGRGSGAADGPGVTARTITIGFTYYQSAHAANEALGAKGLDFGDPVASARVLVKHINDTGGVAGRRLDVLYYGIDPQSSTPYATEAQTECSYFTEDHKVLAVLDGTPAVDDRNCLAQHGVAFLGGPLIASALTANEVDAYTAGLDRAFTALVPALVRSGWFGGWDRLRAQAGNAHAKVGIVTPDSTEDDRAVDQVLIPALRTAGYGPAAADVIRISPPGGFTDDGATVAAIDNAALKLNADGVDHVILNDGNGSLSLLFNNYAYSQRYFPRYGGTSGNAWQVLLTAGDLQAKTLNGAMGIGWQPLFDVPYRRGDSEGPYPNSARRQCFGVFDRVGQTHTDAATAGAQAEGCDVAFLLPAILRGYRGPVNLGTLLARVDGLGTSYPLASGFASRFAPGQHDGAGAYAALQFATGCGCVQYSGRPQPMPR